MMNGHSEVSLFLIIFLLNPSVWHLTLLWEYRRDSLWSPGELLVITDVAPQTVVKLPLQPDKFLGVQMRIQLRNKQQHQQPLQGRAATHQLSMFVFRLQL